MSNNLKTWPEILRARNWHQNTNNTMQFDAYLPHVEINGEGIVQYIRADIAKERENKLIKEALTYGYSMADYLVRPKDRDIPFVFFNAGLEELK